MNYMCWTLSGNTYHIYHFQLIIMTKLAIFMIKVTKIDELIHLKSILIKLFIF